MQIFAFVGSYSTFGRLVTPRDKWAVDVSESRLLEGCVPHISTPDDIPDDTNAKRSSPTEVRHHQPPPSLSATCFMIHLPRSDGFMTRHPLLECHILFRLFQLTLPFISSFSIEGLSTLVFTWYRLYWVDDKKLMLPWGQLNEDGLHLMERPMFTLTRNQIYTQKQKNPCTQELGSERIHYC